MVVVEGLIILVSLTSILPLGGLEVQTMLTEAAPDLLQDLATLLPSFRVDQDVINIDGYTFNISADDRASV